jgi:hypothetical protein
MENVIEAIRASLAPDASAEARNAGIQACRAVLTALGAKPGEAFSAPRQVDVGPTAQAIAAVIRATPPEQLLDLVVTKLRGAVPDAKPVEVTHKINIPLVRIPTP